MSFILLALAAGTIGGFLDAMAGSGFGATAASALSVGGVSAATAVASVNIAKIASGITGSVAHHRLGNVRPGLALPLAGGGVAGALAGGRIASSMPGESMQAVLHSALLLAAVLIAWLQLRRRGGDERGPISGGAIGLLAPTVQGPFGAFTARYRETFTIVLIGLAAGLANTLAGAFGPVVMAGLLLAHRRGHPRFAVGSVSVAEVIVAAAGVLSLAAFFGEARISLEIAVPLAVGGIIAAPVGALFTRRISPRRAALFIAALLVVLNSVALARLVTT